MDIANIYQPELFEVNMNIVVFGAGTYYKRYKQYLSNEHIVAIIDNNPEIQNMSLDGIMVYAPSEIKKLKFDKVVLMAANAYEMDLQLIKIGIPSDKIIYWNAYNSLRQAETFDITKNTLEWEFKEGQKNILFVASYLNYDGASIAIVYAYKALSAQNFNVLLVAPQGSNQFIKEMRKQGVKIVIIPELPYLTPKVLDWVKLFDAVVVNVFPMIMSACEISKIRPVLWWIHESAELYLPIMTEFKSYIKKECFNKINIVAVSNVAKKNFNNNCLDIINKTLPYGIPDTYKNNKKDKTKKNTIIAIVGTISSIKGHKLLINAFNKVNPDKNTKLWIVGAGIDSKYGSEVKQLIQSLTIKDRIILMGELSREEIDKCYRDIDVVVCASLQDSLPIVITEAMMYKKVCICSDKAGSADYITDGVNGFIFRSGDIDNLANVINRVLNNKDEWQAIGENARRTYEKYFSMDSFGKRLKQAIIDTESQYWRKDND